MTKFMSTKERCLQCGEKLEKAMVITNDNKNVCSASCKNNWESELIKTR